MSVTYNTLTLKNGVEMFYRESGKSNNETLLLLHGFPTSSRQFSHLIPLLSNKFHVVAPDLPAFGETKIPEDFEVTFDNLSKSVGLLLNELKISTFSVYIFDYGAPTGLRLALEDQFTVKAIVSQNGNAYIEGIQEFWDPIRKVWDLVDKSELTPAEKEQLEIERENLAQSLFMNLKPYTWQYFNGEPDGTIVNPEDAKVDFELLMNYPNTRHNQLALFTDYRKNLPLYPKFQEYFRESNVPILAIWGVNDFIFPKEGQEAFTRDSKNVKVVELDAGHFVSVNHASKLAENILAFFEEYNL
ncbi:hypothetical protein CLIB1444_03S03972 [[Candida] jaroonii]|uniref:Uncharacterized protein n=1 Tax=[Candida] jaroonii TaxID=467808 RepID=A0ACA9Y6P2_9ASCO|nr:hypothetical protein CLIB1444_03S03972 [[Candida] jaroonii]